MKHSRIKLSSVVESQLPQFVREDFPLVAEFLKEYYKSLDSAGNPYDILQNIDSFVKVDNNSKVIYSTELTSDLQYGVQSISVTSTEGFPDRYGMLKINEEIILYKSKTQNTFQECVRGFSGVSFSESKDEELVFSDTIEDLHSSGDEVINLSLSFLPIFYRKLKSQFLPGFEDRKISDGVDKSLFLKNSRDFYTSKGTEKSFKILFKVLFGVDVAAIRPSDFLLEPSKPFYKVDKVIIVEPIQGDLLELKNKTIFQDEDDYYYFALGSVNSVSKLVKNNKEYYQLNLDYSYNKDIFVDGSFFGEFQVHSRTKLIENIEVGQNYISVDSTVGFPRSGRLSLPGVLGEVIVEYEEKTLTQFLGCTGITEAFPSETIASIDSYVYSFQDSGDEIRFRITGVISNADVLNDGKYIFAGDEIKISSLGYSDDFDIRLNEWIFNISVNCKVKEFTDDGNLNYSIETYDNNNIYNNDLVEVDYLTTSGERQTTKFLAKTPINSVPGRKFKIVSSSEIANIFSIRKVVSTFKDTGLSNDVQNTYIDLEDSSRYVTASSLPNYQNTKINDFKINLSGTYEGDTFNFENHGFITGEAIVYNSSSVDNIGINSGVYFVKKVDNDNFKIARSKSDIFENKFIRIFKSTVESNYFYPLRFSDRNRNLFDVGSQRLVRNVKGVEYDENTYTTPIGKTGILLNGVELLNYKSEDFMYYGPIESIDITSGGEEYDLINLPKLTVTEAFEGAGSPDIFVGGEGILDRIDVIDGGFNFIDEPNIEITGGGGSGAIAKANLIDSQYSEDFNSTSKNSKILINDLNQIGFSTYHKFVTGDYVKYKTNGGVNITGITTGANYFIGSVDDFSVRLYETQSDALSGINTVDISGYGSGVHTLEFLGKKRKIGSITVVNSGFGYKNKKILVDSTGINTYKDSISVYEHPYQSGEIIYYRNENGSPPSGITTGSYYVTRISSKEFKLSQIGLGNTIGIGRSTDPEFYYKNKVYLNIKTAGSGNHIFNYPDIEVKLSYNAGVSTSQNRLFEPTIKPIFKGPITHTFVNDGSIGYGSSEIINYNRQPVYFFDTGSDAEIKPIISDGKIVSVAIFKGGSNYFSSPSINISGDGYGAILTPIVENGVIVDVKVISQGVGYGLNTTLEILTTGTGANLSFNSKKWSINKFHRLLNSNKIDSDDGVIFRATNANYGTQYTHLYPSRNLRKKIFSVVEIDGILNYRSDYNNDFEENKYHSPILGWSYDGSPIYGPYGYVSSKNKNIKRMVSGYDTPRDDAEGRPNKTIFPAGFFIEDYSFTGKGDLDESNGRYVATPEFPGGVYAYFMTVGEQLVQGGPFDGELMPVFPYVIGENYKFKPNAFNFDLESTQDVFNFEKNNILRNTYPYNLTDENSDYKFVNNPIKITTENPKVLSSTIGPVERFDIISGGKNYKIGDNVLFDESLVAGTGAIAKVSKLFGKTIDRVYFEDDIINDIEFYPINSRSLIGFTSSPHNLTNSDVVSIDSLDNTRSELKGKYNIGVTSSKLYVSTDVDEVSQTGLVTYFNVIGDLNFPKLIEDDILSSNGEKIKILNIDKENSRIRVLRTYDGSISTSHTSPAKFIEESRKFVFGPNKQLNVKGLYLNRKIYFDPQESLSLGVGIGTSTIYFSNPGSGKTIAELPEKSIYIKNHAFKKNTPLVYHSNSGSGIDVSNGISTFTLSDGQLIYANKLSNDLIGISTAKVAIGTQGQYVGIGTTASTLYFIGVGAGRYHSFTTVYSSVRGSLSKNKVIVETTESHGLLDGDSIEMNIVSGITTQYYVEYNDYYRRIILNKRTYYSIDVSNSTLYVPNHKLRTGQKVIHNSSSPADGLEDNRIYYVLVYNKDRIKLCDTFYNSIVKNKPVTLNILSSSSGYISPINPPIDVTKNQKITFDLSDSSLSIPFGIGRTSCFNFNIWIDSNYNQKYLDLDDDGSQIVQYFGQIGCDEDARVEIIGNSFSRNELYYTLDPIVSEENLEVKTEREIDDEVPLKTKISYNFSKYNGKHKVSGIGQSSFEYTITEYPESLLYDSATLGISTYKTDSKTASGTIDSISVISGGKYDSIPGVSSVRSQFGRGAILVPDSDTIGRVEDVEIPDIGYDYSSDPTIKPYLILPTILRVEPLSGIEQIKITSKGKNYTTNPNLVIIDDFTNKIIDDIILECDLEKEFVNIIRNTSGIYNSIPKVIPINNSNGVKISNIEFSSGEVTVTLNKQFSEESDFPFQVGDKVLVEGVSVASTVGSASTFFGYNSRNYGYDTFEITEIDPNLGGSKSTVKYSLSKYLSGSQNPGLFDKDSSAGRIIPENDFPTFEVELNKNQFFIDEEIYTDFSKAKLLEYDDINDLVKLSTHDSFSEGDVISGKYSNSKAIVKSVFSEDSYSDVTSSAVIKYGWQNQQGFLDDYNQRIHNSDYYQYFSYSLQSQVDYETWKEPVTTLNHTLGFKKFSDLQIYSSTTDFSGISTNQNNGVVTLICDLNSIVDTYCIYDFDLVFENNFYADSFLASDEIRFSSKIIKDYIESVGNRVLIIDDISDEFNTTLDATFVTSFSI